MTAVEWLWKALLDSGFQELENVEGFYYQAKEMEDKQIVKAFFQGVDRESDGHGAMYLSRKDAESYYNETFKSE